ncbi:ISXo8 transposase [Candidatus Magnetobacterium bavaricum]|uniref:ISXo8 transposase n=1 Tax=Candidatus Magnetobacterium bavaricum TaxID=29290 RepID=A0A0F3GTD7_9BACT|nr:ISXo8 transposase [Candidatus Magnetobacterium bavaricum]
MQPQYQVEIDTYSVPKMELVKEDIDGFMVKLQGFHSEFADCFEREAARQKFYQYMVGQFSDLERKSIEPISFKVDGGKVRNIQRLISDTKWDESLMLSKYHNMVSSDMGDGDGVLIFDESGFTKKGSDSVAVARQYCGTIGKVDNCQVGVFTAYASRHGYALLDKRLFIPEKWFTDDYADKRTKTGLPGSIGFKTKPQLAAEMFTEISKAGTIAFKSVVSDTLYGNSPDFIEAVESVIGITYLVSIPCDTLLWIDEPVVLKKEYKHKGQKKTKKEVHSGKKPIRVDRFAKALNDCFWYRRKVSEGTKGAIEYEFTKRRVILSKNGAPYKTVWLLVKRTLEDSPTYYYYMSNASVSTRLKRFIWLSGIRWAIEQCFGEAKTELGMDHYEVRKYSGWNHHMLTCILAHFFLWHLRIILGEKISAHYSVSD